MSGCICIIDLLISKAETLVRSPLSMVTGSGRVFFLKNMDYTLPGFECATAQKWSDHYYIYNCIVSHLNIDLLHVHSDAII